MVVPDFVVDLCTSGYVLYSKGLVRVRVSRVTKSREGLWVESHVHVILFMMKVEQHQLLVVIL